MKQSSTENEIFVNAYHMEQLQRNVLTYTTTHKENETHERFLPLVFFWCQKRDRKQYKKKAEKKKIDKKLKQNNFQKLNVNFEEHHQNDKN